MDRSQYLPHNELSDLKRQISYYESLKKRARENCEKKIADYDGRQDRIAARIAVLETEASPINN